MSDTSSVQPTKLTNSRSFRTWTTWSHRSPTSTLTETNEKNPSSSRRRPRPSLSTAFLPLNRTNGTKETLSTPTPLPYHSPLPSPPPPPPLNAKRSKFRFSSITAIFRKRGSKSLSRESEFSGEDYLDMLRDTNKTKGDEGFGEQMTVVKSQSHQVSGSSMLPPLLSRSSSNGSVSECVTVPSNSTPPIYISQTRSCAKSAGRRHSFPVDNVFSSEGSTAKDLDRVKQKKAQVRPTGTRRCDPGNHPENRNARPPLSLQWNPKRPDPFYSPGVYPFRHRLRPLWQLLLINRFLASLKRATEEEMDRRGSLSPTCSHQRQLAAAREEELGEAYCSSSTNDPRSFSTAPDPFRIPRTLHSPSPTWIATLQARPWPPPMPPLNLRRGNHRPSCMNPKRRSYTPPKELGAAISDMDDETDSGSYGGESATSEDDDIPLGILQSELHRDSLPLPLLKHRTTYHSSQPLSPPAYSLTSTRKTISTTFSSSSSSQTFAHGRIDPRPHRICWDTLSTTSSRGSNRTLVNTETSDLYSGTRNHSSCLKSSDARGSSPRPWPQTSGTGNYRQGRRRSQPLVTF